MVCMGLKEWIQDDCGGGGMVMIVRAEEHTFEIRGQYFKLEADNFKKRLRYQTGLTLLTINLTLLSELLKVLHTF